MVPCPRVAGDDKSVAAWVDQCLPLAGRYVCMHILITYRSVLFLL